MTGRKISLAERMLNDPRGVLAVQEEMLADLTAEQRARYDALMDPHAGCESAPYCGCDPQCKVVQP